MTSGSAAAGGPVHRQPAGPPVPGLQGPLWRGIAVYRFASLAYVVILFAGNARDYAHPLAAVPVLLAMTGWTVTAVYGYARPRVRRWPLLLSDLVVTMAVLLVSPAVVGRVALADGVPTLAVAWMGAPVLAWAVCGGRRRGVIAALLLGAVDLAIRVEIDRSSLNGTILMLLAGVAVGHGARLAASAEERLQRAVELEAATRERERLARGIHDSVLQVLALVQRRGAHLDGEAGELARLAGEQEAALRSLIAVRLPPPADPRLAEEETDLRTVVGRYASSQITIAMPATPVPLPAAVAGELGAAAGAALDNVARHGGGRAWVLLEDEGDRVTVSIRDEGPGIPVGRLDEAADQGRLGVAQSIRRRMADLGGDAHIRSTPGEGTEVELSLSRPTRDVP